MGRLKEPTRKKQTAVYLTPIEIKLVNKKARLSGMRYSQFVRVTTLTTLGIKIEDEP
ncbi:MAG: hypothetical protein KGI08_03620 [Thaumarchaeota archaeon]|nr:hypothetical protein [Nitrososphaerota archaeon]